MSHTPGPWKIHWGSKYPTIKNFQGWFILEHIAHHPFVRHLEDAPLIASAPDLLQTLRDVDIALEKTINERFEALEFQLKFGPHRLDKIQRIGQHLGRLGSALMQTRAAIAKAEGKS